MTTKRILKARDIERLENTSFASIIGDAQPAPPEIPFEPGTCSCDCNTCLCCLPNTGNTALCCDVTVVYTLDGRCAVGTSRLLNVEAQ